MSGSLEGEDGGNHQVRTFRVLLEQVELEFLLNTAKYFFDYEFMGPLSIHV